MVGTILSKFGTLECFPLNVRTGEYLAQSNVRSERLHVNGECVNGNDVSFTAYFNDDRHCRLFSNVVYWVGNYNGTRNSGRLHVLNCLYCWGNVLLALLQHHY